MSQGTIDNTASIETPSELVSESATPSWSVLPAPLATAVRLLIFFQIIALPIFFGGVHAGVYLPLWTVSFALIGAALAVRPGILGELFSWSRHRCSAAVCLGLIAVLLYSALHFGMLQRSASAHPILGRTGAHPDPRWFFTSWRELAYALSTFVLVRTFIAASHSRAHLILQLAAFAGFVVSFIALAHWFYDNGKLFWIFAPDTVFVAERARWPFVNSNHLGDYLTISFFLFLFLTSTGFQHVLELRRTRGRRRMQSIAMLVTSDRFVRRVVRPLSLTVPLLCVSLSIIACLSRGAWLGTSAGLLLYIWLSGVRRPDPEPPPEADEGRVIPFSSELPASDGGSRRSSRRRRRSTRFRDNERYLHLMGLLPKLAKPILAVFAVTLIAFFLNERGRQLFVERIDYGLTHSIDDMRWTFYQDSMPILQKNLLFGTGLGTWLSEYRRYQNEALTGLNPGYLHSDPLQILIELGVVGVLPILFIICVVLWEGVAAVRRAIDPGLGWRISALLCGLIALGISSLPEFPFRIPAITTLLMIILATASFYIEIAQQKQ